MKLRFYMITTVFFAIFLIGIVNSGNADFEIVEMTSDTYEYTQSVDTYPYHFAHVKTSDPYYSVEWYVDGVYKKSSYGERNNPKFDAYFYPFPIDGSITGQNYTIKAVAYPMDDEDPNGTTNATESYTLTVFQPITETQTTREKKGLSPRFPDVSGYINVHRQFYNGSIIGLEATAFARNASSAEDSTEMYGKFRHTILNKPFDERETFMPTKDVLPGESYGPYHSGLLDFPCIEILDDETWNSNAYIRLKMRDGSGVDDFYYEKTIEFTEAHNIDP